MPPAPLPLSVQATRTSDSPISYFIQKAIETPGLISLAAGLVDESSLPAENVAEAVAAIMADPTTARAALQYGSTQGYVPLRKKVLAHVCQADGVKPEDIDPTGLSVVLSATPDPNTWLLNPELIAAIPEVGNHYNKIWDQTLASAILEESEVIVDGPVDVTRCTVVRQSIEDDNDGITPAKGG